MTDVSQRGARSSAGDPFQDVHSADPWWGTDVGTRALAPAAPRAGRRPARAPRQGAGWLVLGLAASPFAWLLRRVRRSPALRRLALRTTIVAIILLFLASSVGVILVNNVVIGRTAELGKLDDRRRELRRDNALAGDKLAKLSAPTLVQNRASKQLGMVRSTELPTFIFLDPANRALTPFQRAKIRLREERRAAILARRAQAAAAPVTTAPVVEPTP